MLYHQQAKAKAGMKYSTPAHDQKTSKTKNCGTIEYLNPQWRTKGCTPSPPYTGFHLPPQPKQYITFLHVLQGEPMRRVGTPHPVAA